MIKNRFLIEWIISNYPIMDIWDESDLRELDFYDMDKFAFWLEKTIKGRIQIGDQVEDGYGHVGIVVEEFENFSDLVSKVNFSTMSADQWLKEQKRPINNKNLEEKWFTVDIYTGGAVWVFESSLKKL